MTFPPELSLTTCTDFNQIYGSDVYDGWFGRIYTMNENVPGAKGAKYNYKTPKEPKTPKEKKAKKAKKAKKEKKA